MSKLVIILSLLVILVSGCGSQSTASSRQNQATTSPSTSNNSNTAPPSDVTPSQKMLANSTNAYGLMAVHMQFKETVKGKINNRVPVALTFLSSDISPASLGGHFTATFATINNDKVARVNVNGTLTIEGNSPVLTFTTADGEMWFGLGPSSAGDGSFSGIWKSLTQNETKGNIILER